MRHLLARLFLPSWRFFDDAFSSTVLQGSVVTDAGETPTWQDLLEPPRRRLSHVLWNPAGNLTLAKYSLVERLVEEANETTGDPLQLVSCDLVTHLVREELQSRHPSAFAAFKFRVIDREDGPDHAVLQSAEHTW